MRIKDNKLRDEIRELMARDDRDVGIKSDDYIAGNTKLNDGDYITVVFGREDITITNEDIVFSNGDVYINDHEDNLVDEIMYGFKSLAVYGGEVLEWDCDESIELDQEIVEDLLRDLVYDCLEKIQ